jgi:hypothetical protein
MIQFRLRLKEEEFEFLKAMVADEQAPTMQDLVMKLIYYSLRKKYGVEEIDKWKYYEKTKIKQTIYKPSHKIVPVDQKKISHKINPPQNENTSVNKSTINYSDSEENVPFREQLRQSSKQRLKEEQQEDIFTNIDELRLHLQRLTQRDKWEQALHIAQKQDDEMQYELEDFYEAYNAR